MSETQALSQAVETTVSSVCTFTIASPMTVYDTRRYDAMFVVAAFSAALYVRASSNNMEPLLML